MSTSCCNNDQKASDNAPGERNEQGCVPAKGPNLTPVYRVETRDEGGKTLKVEMPGVRKDDVSVSFDDGVLTIEGRRESQVPASWRTLRVETASRPGFRLQLGVSDRLDAEKSVARVEAGILELQVPLKEEAKPRVIEIA